MAVFCCIVPEYVLRAIVEKGRAPEHVIAAAHSTIERATQIRSGRSQHGQSIAASARRTQGIIPPYVHENIARLARTAEQREASLRSLQHDAKLQTAAGPVRNLKRTIYDANHSWDDIPPRNEIVIQEGGPVLTDVQDPSKDANECYIGLKKTYDFYFEHFKRDSIDGRGMKLDGFVHYGERFDNAMWDGKELIFGEGDGVVFDGFTDELDVIAHEFTHGVVQYTSQLNYKFQSGALNESLADVFGIMVKQWAERPDQPQTVDEANWLIGEGIWAEGVSGRALRDMKHPGTAYNDSLVGKDPQPGHWDDFQVLTLQKDRGGVHINSGIPNRAFCLAAKMIGGYAWEGAGQVWYEALKTGKLGENATFKEFADLTINVAGAHVDKVQEAWRLVGYPFPPKSPSSGEL